LGGVDQRLRHDGELRHAGVDRQRRLVDPAEFLGARMNVHERLLGDRDVEQRVAGSRHLAKAGADDDQQVGVLHPRGELGIDADTDVARIIRMAVVEQVLAAERAADRQVRRLGEGADVGNGLS
jgi:hypothetical protein